MAFASRTSAKVTLCISIAAVSTVEAQKKARSCQDKRGKDKKSSTENLMISLQRGLEGFNSFGYLTFDISELLDTQVTRSHVNFT